MPIPPVPIPSLVPVSLYEQLVDGVNPDRNFDFNAINLPYAAPFGLLGSVSILNLGPDLAFAAFNVALAPAAAMGNGIFPLAVGVPYNASPVSLSNVWVTVEGGGTAGICVTGIPQPGSDSGGTNG